MVQGTVGGARKRLLALTGDCKDRVGYVTTADPRTKNLEEEMAQTKRISSNARVGGVLSTVGIVVITCVVILSLQQLGELTTNKSLDSGGNAPLATGGGLRSPSSGSSPFGIKIPEGLAVALPSVPTSAEEEKDIKRSIYGGKGDKAHLGGFTSFDPQVSRQRPRGSYIRGDVESSTSQSKALR